MLNGEQLTTLERKLERFARILTEKPNDELTVLALAEASFRRGLRLEALTAYQDVVRKRPVPEAHLAVAEIYQGQKMHSEAYDELRRLFQLDPENVEARMLANILGQEVPPPADLNEILQEPTSEQAFDEARLRLIIQRTIFNRELQERTRNVTLQPGVVIHEYHVEEAKKRLISVDEQLRHLEKLRDENKTLVSRPRAELLSAQGPEAEVVESFEASSNAQGEVTLEESELHTLDSAGDLSPSAVQDQASGDSDNALLPIIEDNEGEPSEANLSSRELSEEALPSSELSPQALDFSSSEQDQAPVEDSHEETFLGTPDLEVVGAPSAAVAPESSQESLEEETALSSDIDQAELPVSVESEEPEIQFEEADQERAIVEIETEVPLEQPQDEAVLSPPELVSEDHPEQVLEDYQDSPEDLKLMPQAAVQRPVATSSEPELTIGVVALSPEVSQVGNDIMTPFAGDFEFDSPLSPDLPDNDELLPAAEEQSLDSDTLTEPLEVGQDLEAEPEIESMVSLESSLESQEVEQSSALGSPEQVDEAETQTSIELEPELSPMPEHPQTLASLEDTVSPAAAFGQPSEARMAFYSESRNALSALMTSSLSRTRGVTSMFLITRDGLCVDAVVNDSIAGETLAELVQQSFEFLETFASEPSYWVLECEGGIFVMQRLDNRHVLIAIGQAGANFGALRYTMDKMKEKFEQLLAQVPD